MDNVNSGSIPTRVGVETFPTSKLQSMMTMMVMMMTTTTTIPALWMPSMIISALAGGGDGDVAGFGTYCEEQQSLEDGYVANSVVVP